MTTARDIMNAGATCIGEDQTLYEAAQMMRDLNVGSLPICGNDKKLHGIITDRDLVHDVRVGHRVQMDDGLLSSVIERIDGDKVTVRMLEGGILKNRKGVNFPDSVLSLPALSEKDTRDLMFGISHGVDFIARAQGAAIATRTVPFRLAQANEALAALRSGALSGAAVLTMR